MQYPQVHRVLFFHKFDRVLLFIYFFLTFKIWKLTEGISKPRVHTLLNPLFFKEDQLSFGQMFFYSCFYKTEKEWTNKDVKFYEIVIIWNCIYNRLSNPSAVVWFCLACLRWHCWLIRCRVPKCDVIKFSFCISAFSWPYFSSTWIGSWGSEIWPHEYLISPIESSINWPGS